MVLEQINQIFGANKVYKKLYLLQKKCASNLHILQKRCTKVALCTLFANCAHLPVYTLLERAAVHKTTLHDENIITFGLTITITMNLPLQLTCFN